MIVVATDAPLSDRNLRRLASRAIIGLGRTGSVAANGSGDYVIAFSTNPDVRRPMREPRHRTSALANEEMSVRSRRFSASSGRIAHADQNETAG